MNVVINQNVSIEFYVLPDYRTTHKIRSKRFGQLRHTYKYYRERYHDDVLCP